MKAFSESKLEPIKNRKHILLCMFGGIKKIKLPNGKTDYTLSSEEITAFPTLEEVLKVQDIFSDRMPKKHMKIVRIHII